MFKFFINANLNIRAKRRYLEYRKLKNKITFKEVLKNLKKGINLIKIDVIVHWLRLKIQS